MRKHFAMAIASAVMLTCFGATAFADGDTDLRARLRGLNEVPPTTNRATASLIAEINADETAITFTLSFENLTANPAQAHIHFGPTKVNGGVMVFFCGGPKPACPAATTGTVTGTITAADIVGPAAQGLPAAPAGKFADVVRAIKTGNAYANIHNANFPGGEVRGQVIAFGGDHNDD
jgi:CHRD domain-containing protein